MSLSPALPLNDPARLAALRRLGLLDSEAEEAFDRLTRLVRQFLDVPASVVTLVDEKRQFFKAASGLTGRLAEERGSPLSHSFCQHVVTKGEAVIVDLAPGHPVVGDNPAIRDSGVMAYLGVPVRSPDGFVIGTLCAFDIKPRQWTPQQVSLMRELAQVVMDEISLRYENRERVRAEAELKETNRLLERSEQRFRNAFDHAGIGMALVSPDGRWLQVNRVLSRILGYSEDELLTKTFQDITHPADLNADLAHLADLLAGNIDHYQMEKRYFHRDGHVVHVQLTVSLVRDAAGVPVHFISQVEDITESKQFVASLAAARDEALAASRLKSEFLANMSHEIRTPMNGVIGMADLLLDSPLTADQQQMGQVIRSSAENLLTIINDILDFSKIEAGKLSIELQDFSLAEEIQQAVALLTPRARERDLTLVAELPADLPHGLNGDGGRIQQVLVNLVGNAVKFTQTGGVTVSVLSRTAARPGRYAFRVEVRDTGIGIPPAAGSRLFQPFTQADGSTTRKYGGTGLGLAISQQLVALMDGRIGFESEVGQGSIFWFELELPVVAVPMDGPGTAGERSAVACDPAIRVLVAEDNAANQLVIRLLLQKIGVAFDIVADGHAVLERLAAREYAAVLMDCQMPQLDGYETTRRIRAQAAGVRQPRIPIIALTAHAMASDRDKCLEAGMDGYLAKPVRVEELSEAFQRAGIFATPESSTLVPASSRRSVLDAAQLAQLRELPGREGGSLLDDLIGMALRDLPPEITRLHGAVVRRAGEEVTQLAHRLAGSAANLGAVGLRQSLQDLEYAGRKAEWPAAERGRLALDREWNATRAALESLQGAPS